MKTIAFALIAFVSSATAAQAFDEPIPFNPPPSLQSAILGQTGVLNPQMNAVDMLRPSSGSTSPKFPEMTSNPLSLSDPLVLEYRIGTHVEAMALKFGQLDQAEKRCKVGRGDFEEHSLSDSLGDNLPPSAVPLVKRSYDEGKSLSVPSCAKVPEFISLVQQQIDRHKAVILQMNGERTKALIELQRKRDEETSLKVGK